MHILKNDENIVLKNVHCPYCESDDAVLISKSSEMITSIQLPQYGLKYVLSVLYLSFLYMWIHGYKIIEKKRVFQNVTYAFCPKCGNSYLLEPSKEEIKKEREEIFRRCRDGKLISGLCAGIAKYTGISLRWIRIMTVLFGLITFGGAAIIYALVSLCVPYEDGSIENLENAKEPMQKAIIAVLAVIAVAVVVAVAVFIIKKIF